MSGALDDYARGILAPYYRGHPNSCDCDRCRWIKSRPEPTKEELDAVGRERSQSFNDLESEAFREFHLTPKRG